MTNDRPLPPDAQQRARAIDAVGSLLVQSPAGSGKTTLLTQRYLRLLAQVEAPERILALTFTRMAAHEMRERVLLALAAADAPLCPERMPPATFALARAARAQLERCGIDIAVQPARLRIETIDSFNAWLAGQLLIGAGTGAAQRVQSDARAMYIDAARRTLAYDGDDAFGAAVERLLELDDQRWRPLVKMLSGMLPERGRWLPLLVGSLRASAPLDAARLATVRRQFDEDLAVLVTRSLERAAEALGSARLERLSALAQRAAQRPGAHAGRLTAWLGEPRALTAQPHEVARWRCLAVLCLTQDGKARKRVTVSEGFPPGCDDLLPMKTLLADLDTDRLLCAALQEVRCLPAAQYSDAQWERVRDIAQVLILAAAQLDAVFAEQGEVDFPAVARAALQALGGEQEPSDLALKLDYRLQHVLIDEFQDTSSAQLELLRRLSAGWQPDDGRSLFCVGDPMQSIYGFRQAEVRAFLELAEEGIGDVPLESLHLSSNFRSTPALIEWINRTFRDILPRADDRSRGAIAFRPSVAAQLDAPAELPAVELLGFADRAAEAHGVAALIADALARQPRWRIAVLVRARSHAREIAAALQRCGTAFRAVQIEPLRERSAVRDIINLAAALLHLADRTAWLALLRAPWTGLGLSDLLQVAQGGGNILEALHDAAVVARLSEDGAQRCRQLAAVFEEAWRVRNESSFARWVERVWIALGGPACITEEELALADAAFQKLAGVSAARLAEVGSLAALFEGLFADHGADARVEIMTIHKAKGLEFDMVVLPALDRGVTASRSPLLLIHEFSRSVREGMVMGARAPLGAEPDELFEYLKLREREAGALESRRLLYVACTRAKQLLRLTCVAPAEPEVEKCSAEPRAGEREEKKPHAGSLLHVLWGVERMRRVGAAPAATPSETSEAGELRGRALRRVPSGWAPPTPPSLASSAPPLEPLRVETPVFDWAGETARRVGILVHAQMQRLDLAHSSAAMIAAREPDYARWLANGGVPAERLGEAARRITAALLGVLSDARGRWILAPQHTQASREQALSGIIDGQIARAVFDRMFVADGTRWIIDYKTSFHEGGGLEEFLDREVIRYRPQLDRYALLARHLGPEPIRLALYFPLLQAWREWGAPAS